MLHKTYKFKYNCKIFEKVPRWVVYIKPSKLKLTEMLDRVLNCTYLMINPVTYNCIGKPFQYGTGSDVYL